jgi:hypothetical protein
MSFIPDNPMPQSEAALPFYEDAEELKIPGTHVTRALEDYQEAITGYLFQLGANRVKFIPGKHEGAQPRYGYQITFVMNGIPGRFDIAALPMRAPNPRKKNRALAQALYLAQEWLKAEVFSHIYRPGAIPLLPYLIGADDQTVTEALVKNRDLPLLPGNVLSESKGGKAS